jgi:splicing factor 3A subunit 1
MMSLARPDMRIEEAMPTDDMNGYLYNDPYQVPAQAPSWGPGPPAPAYIPLTPQATATHALPQQSSFLPTPPVLPAPPTPISPAPAPGQPPMRIRQDYIPRAQQRAARPTTALCPNCGQQIPINELDNHLRIELLDPEWKKQQAKATARSATTNLGGTDVAANLKRLRAQTDRAHNADPVAEAAGRVLAEQEEEERRKRMRLDGSSDAVAYAGASPTVDTGRPVPAGKDLSVQEQIRLIHSKAGKT